MLSISLEDFDYKHVILCEAIKNSIILYNNFYKLLYSNEFVTFNGIFILFNLNYNYIIKDKIFFDVSKNYNIIDKLNNIEYNILDILSIKKEKQLKLKEFLKNGIIKFSNCDYDEIDEDFIKLKKINQDNIENFILKLSGIWENKDYIGITFKVINVKNIIKIY
tara:strand:- start:15383 stop:15874 length:492 start_codon:yes stop_codon:yes gene_type:complete